MRQQGLILLAACSTVSCLQTGETSKRRFDRRGVFAAVQPEVFADTSFRDATDGGLSNNQHFAEYDAEETPIESRHYSKTSSQIDRRPHEQRVEKPRKARRLNHPFQHLYRYSDPRWDDNDWNDGDIHWDHDLELIIQESCSEGEGCEMGWHSSISTELLDGQTARSAIQYLYWHGGYTAKEIKQLQTDFPPLLELDVIRHLRPKMRFLKDCLGGSFIESASDDGHEPGHNIRQVLHPKLKSSLPAHYFGSRLERTIAPRHAFLVHVGLPYGKALWDGSHSYEERQDKTTLLVEFLAMHRKPKQFAALCNDWRKRFRSSTDSNELISSNEIVAFDKLFQRGLLSAARNDTGYIFADDDKENNEKKGMKNDNLLDTANVTSGKLIRYLVQHGANPFETDVRGASLFHWASGCGNLEGLQALVDCCNQISYTHAEIRKEMKKEDDDINYNPGMKAALLWKASRDHATPFHWAAAGAGLKEFGIGGHLSICAYLLSLCRDSSTGRQIIPERKLINAQTLDGNSILMWAAWSRSLDVVKLLIRNRADAINVANRNGCTVAHWAASGGSLEVCRFLAELVNVNFETENHAGNTPLDHAVAYRRVDVVRWLKEDLGVNDNNGKAMALALDFVNWADMGLVSSTDESQRRQVYDLFLDWSQEMGEDADGDIN